MWGIASGTMRTQIIHGRVRPWPAACLSISCMGLELELDADDAMAGCCCRETRTGRPSGEGELARRPCSLDRAVDVLVSDSSSMPASGIRALHALCSRSNADRCSRS